MNDQPDDEDGTNEAVYDNLRAGPTYATPPAQRTLPHNIECEKALLGAIFSDNRAHERVCEFLRPEHFAVPENGDIYGECIRLIDGNKRADPITLMGFVENNDDLKDMGGKVYLAELAASAVTIMNAGEYGRIIYELFVRRELIALATTMSERAYSPEESDTVRDQIEAAEVNLCALVGTSADNAMVHVRDAILEAVKEIEAAKKEGGFVGLETGLVDVDLVLGGIGGGDLMILGGGTSMGKTAAAVKVAIHNAKKYRDTGGKEGAVVMFESLEMRDTELAKRVLSVDSGISATALRHGNVKNWGALVEASNGARDIPLYIDSTPGATVQGIRQRARRLKRKHGLGLIIVDYLQLITPDKQYSGQRVNEVGQISRGLKSMAIELDVPVIALSQLSRQVDARDDHRPRKADLRESGSLEQDADTIMFMFRPEYYTAQEKPVRKGDKEKFFRDMAAWEERMEDEKGKAEAIIAKNRHGPAGETVEIYFDGPCMTFENLARG